MLYFRKRPLFFVAGIDINLGCALSAKVKTWYHPLYAPQGPQRDLMFTDLHIDNGLKNVDF